jgi:hypothetical protein
VFNNFFIGTWLAFDIAIANFSFVLNTFYGLSPNKKLMANKMRLRSTLVVSSVASNLVKTNMPWFLCDKYQVNKTAPKPLT